MTSFADLFGAELLDTDGKTVVATADKLKDRVTAVYFSAHWCPPCRGFTPKLAETYTAYKEKGLKFKVRGIPTLVILDADGSVITTDGRSAVSEDPTGAAFASKHLYFSAHWCPPCRGFTPKLAEAYKAYKE